MKFLRTSLIALLAIVSFTAGGGYTGKAWAVPAIPEGYHQDFQDYMPCENEAVILKQGWTNEAGEYIVIFKEPNKPARIYLHWPAGASDGPDGADVIYVDENQVALTELLALAPNACSLFAPQSK